MISVRISHLHTLFRCVLNDVTMLNGGIGEMVLNIDAEAAIYFLIDKIQEDAEEIGSKLSKLAITDKETTIDPVMSDLIFRVGDLELAWEEYKTSRLNKD